MEDKNFKFDFQLSMQNNDAAKYLENVVKQRDLMAFACEDKEDMSDLINELCVKQKLGVNIIYCAPSNRCMYSPTIPKSELRYVILLTKSNHGDI